MPLTARKITPCLWFDSQAEAAANRAFLQMRKLDIEALERAYQGTGR